MGWHGGTSFHHNLLAYHDSRNPRFQGSRGVSTPETEIVDHRNNVIYNWDGNSAYGGEAGNHNMVANYYKYGPATDSKRSRIVEPYGEEGVGILPVILFMVILWSLPTTGMVVSIT